MSWLSAKYTDENETSQLLFLLFRLFDFDGAWWTQLLSASSNSIDGKDSKSPQSLPVVPRERILTVESLASGANPCASCT